MADTKGVSSRSSLVQVPMANGQSQRTRSAANWAWCAIPLLVASASNAECGASVDLFAAHSSAPVHRTLLLHRPSSTRWERALLSGSGEGSGSGSQVIHNMPVASALFLCSRHLCRPREAPSGAREPHGSAFWSAEMSAVPMVWAPKRKLIRA
ncbi:GD17530 [Drosophila simulans]|uniref:GD17530 n=1 Tax=Drosophila simulans TaxID=7240 RepID=B4R3R4_DROSI|nr:GD17530 [Drosophila simulans]